MPSGLHFPPTPPIRHPIGRRGRARQDPDTIHTSPAPAAAVGAAATPPPRTTGATCRTPRPQSNCLLGALHPPQTSPSRPIVGCRQARQKSDATCPSPTRPSRRHQPGKAPRRTPRPQSSCPLGRPVPPLRQSATQSEGADGLGRTQTRRTVLRPSGRRRRRRLPAATNHWSYPSHARTPTKLPAGRFPPTPTRAEPPHRWALTGPVALWPSCGPRPPRVATARGQRAIRRNGPGSPTHACPPQRPEVREKGKSPRGRRTQSNVVLQEGSRVARGPSP